MVGGFSTEGVAWYGAIVATVVFVWDIWKWSRRQARLRIKITPLVCYPDGEITSVQKTAHGEVREFATYYHIEVTNIGELPTTVLGATATTASAGILGRVRAWRRRQRGIFGYTGLIAHAGKTLPHVLGPGEVWTCRVAEDRITSLCQFGERPKLELTAACFRQPRLVRFPLPKPGKQVMYM